MHKGRTERAALCAGTALCYAEPRRVEKMLPFSHLDRLVVLLKPALPKVPGRLAHICLNSQCCRCQSALPSYPPGMSAGDGNELLVPSASTCIQHHNGNTLALDPLTGISLLLGFDFRVFR